MEIIKRTLGDLIQASDVKNQDDEYNLSNLKGISIKKRFIETKADMKDVSLKSYLVVKPDYFAYVPTTSRNGEKITIAHNNTQDIYIVSSSYSVFEVSDKENLDATYLFMYFNRPEFDRYSRFCSWGSAREVFTWSEMCDIQIALPPISIQRKYADIFRYVSKSEAYRHLLDKICPILIKGAMDEATGGDHAH